MRREYDYIYGSTNFELHETDINISKYEEFYPQLFLKHIINPVLEKLDCKVSNLVIGRSILNNIYILESNEDFSCVKLLKNITNKGYLYNSSEEKVEYIFFYKRVYDQDSTPIEEINEQDFETKSEIEEITEKINVLSINSNSSPVINNKDVFLQELKLAVKSRKRVDILDKPETIFKQKTDFENELQYVVNLRRDRSRKRERKIQMKKRKK